VQITRTELKNKYGIDLPKGKYRIRPQNKDSYIINTVIDHTEGCLLPGINREVGKVLDSKMYTDIIIEKINEYDFCNIVVKNEKRI